VSGGLIPPSGAASEPNNNARVGKRNPTIACDLQRSLVRRHGDPDAAVRRAGRQRCDDQLTSSVPRAQSCAADGCVIIEAPALTSPATSPMTSARITGTPRVVASCASSVRTSSTRRGPLLSGGIALFVGIHKICAPRSTSAAASCVSVESRQMRMPRIPASVRNTGVSLPAR
jgi:hypothetical protein